MSTKTSNSENSLAAKIEKLRVHTIANGATEQEQHAFALKIGMLIMRNPELRIDDGSSFRQCGPPEWVKVRDVRIIKFTEKAIRVVWADRTAWVPKSLLDYGRTTACEYFPGDVVVPGWFCLKQLHPIGFQWECI